ncbi:DeoR family transcriptional regulator, partial [Wenyingzhuangia sp. 1_MG-2023]|nr:DeoR family transcriptional regulator [Wenyingzhuangia sp. 1_MG-2023]
MSRKKTTRHKAIIDQLTINPSMRVSELSGALGVTTETIRRDLEELAAQQLISRTYGGALLRQPAEPALSERHKANVEERAVIG